MAEVKKVTLKRFNGTDNDDLYPTTSWDQIESKPLTFTPTSHTLNSHSDVSAIPTEDGQALVWDSTANDGAGAWVAGLALSSGGSFAFLDGGAADSVYTTGDVLDGGGA